MAVNLGSTEKIPEGVRNITLCSIAGLLRRRGSTFDDLVRHLAKANRERCVPPLPTSEIRAIAKSIGKKEVRGKTGTRPKKDEDHDHALEKLDLIATAAAVYPWKGRTATSERAVLAAIIKIAKRCASLTPTASHRQIAEDAGLSRHTVGRSVFKLRSAGWLSAKWRYPQITPVPQVVEGTIWTLKLPKSMRHKWANSAMSEAGVAAGCRMTNPLVMACDTWRNGSGLGRTAERVWSQVSVTPLSGAALGRLAGVSARSAQRHLHAMSPHGLVERTALGWVLGPESQEDALLMLESQGETARQVASHQREREAYYEWRVRAAARHLSKGPRKPAKRSERYSEPTILQLVDFAAILEFSPPPIPIDYQRSEAA